MLTFSHLRQFQEFQFFSIAKSENKVLNISPDALDVLLRYNWPGNVIQLENVIERAFALRVALTIEVDDLPSEIKTFGEISKIS